MTGPLRRLALALALALAGPLALVAPGATRAQGTPNPNEAQFQSEETAPADTGGDPTTGYILFGFMALAVGFLVCLPSRRS